MIDARGNFVHSFHRSLGDPDRPILWLIPAVPIAASGLIALLKQPQAQNRILARHRRAGVLSPARPHGLCPVLPDGRTARRCARRSTSPGFSSATTSVDLGWVLDPLSAVMLVMVTFVGLLIFIYSTGYMAHDENFTRFFCFLPVRRSHAGRGHRQQPPASVYVLGARRSYVVSAHRLLVSQALARPPQPKKPSSPRASATSSSSSASSGSSPDRHAALLQQWRRLPGIPRACRVCSLSTPPWAHRGNRHRPAHLLRARQARAASFRCTSGCPTPWKAPRRSPRSSTPRPWWPPASISSPASIH